MKDQNQQLNKKVTERIQSIDALRGFDMLLIVLADKFFRNLHKGVDSEITGVLAEQFTHPKWLGFHLYDVVMPLFLFVVGVVIPFSLDKRLKQKSGRSGLLQHLAKRVIVLFVLGWIVQGRLLALDINSFNVFSNTLQAIAVGYFFSVLSYIYLKKNWRYAFFAISLVLYAALAALPNIPELGNSQLLPDKNFPLYVDRLLLGKFDDGTQYTWIVSSLGFYATVLSGLFAGEILKSTLIPKRKLILLVAIGVSGIILGQVWGIWHPIVKKLWTSSFVLFLSGICFLLLALFYWIVDVKGYQKWAFPLKVIGMNAITAYVLSHVINFPRMANSILFGLKQYTGEYYNLITTIGGFGILYLLLWYMYKNKTFIKV